MSLDERASALEDQINAELAKLPIPMPSPGASPHRALDLIESSLSPGWEWVWTTPVAGPYRIALTRYNIEAEGDHGSRYDIEREGLVG